VDKYLPFLLIIVFALFMFMQSRKAKRNAQDLENSVQLGAEVMLGGGIIANVDAIAGDRVLVTTAGKTQIEVTKRAIVRVLAAPSEVKAAAPVVKKAAAKKVASKKPAAKPVAKKPAPKAAVKKTK